MDTLGENFGSDESAENAIPNRVLLFLEPGTTRLKEYPGDKEMISHLETIASQEQNALREGITLSMRCADGVYECTLDTDNGGITITPINPKPRPIEVHFNDDIFPGEEHILSFLQVRLTKRYKIGTYLSLHFIDKTLSYQIGLTSSETVEGVSNSIHDFVDETLATNSHPGGA